MADSILFCPFCRESFEGRSDCPEHELPLVSWEQLPRPPEPIDHEALLPLFSPAHGRIWVAVGALLTLVAFFLPLASLSGQVTAESSIVGLAQTRERILWVVPCAALVQLFILYRRRSPVAMRGARLAAPLLGVLPAVVVTAVVVGVHEAAALMSERMGSEVVPALGGGAILVWLAAFPSVYGGFRLGLVPEAPRWPGT